MKDGGAVFPSVVGDVGMTLRDYFAGQALAGLASTVEGTPFLKEYAHLAYAFADAMLAEREK